MSHNWIDDDIPARMDPKELPTDVILPQFDGDMWFLEVLNDREKAAVEFVYFYAKLDFPGLPNHLYLKLIHTLSELLNQVNVELEDGF